MSPHDAPCQELVELRSEVKAARNKIEELRIEDKGVSILLQTICERQTNHSTQLNLVLKRFEELERWKNRMLGFMLGSGVLGVGVGAGVIKLVFGG